MPTRSFPPFRGTARFAPAHPRKLDLDLLWRCTAGMRHTHTHTSYKVDRGPSRENPLSGNAPWWQDLGMPYIEQSGPGPISANGVNAYATHMSVQLCLVSARARRQALNGQGIGRKIDPIESQFSRETRDLWSWKNFHLWFCMQHTSSQTFPFGR